MVLGRISEAGIRMRVVDLARACGSVLGRQGDRFAARRTFVRLGLDRLRSLPHSAAMTDALLRGRLAPRAFPRQPRRWRVWPGSGREPTTLWPRL